MEWYGSGRRTVAKEDGGLRLGLVSAILGVLLLAASLLRFLMNSDRWGSEDIARLMGECAGGLLFALIAGFVAFWVSGRKGSAGRIAFGAVAALAILTHGIWLASGSVGTISREANQKLEDQTRLLMSRIRADLKAGKYNTAEHARNFDRALSEYAASAGEKDRVMIEAVQETCRGLFSAQEGYEASLTRLETLGGVEPQTLTSKKKIDERIAAAREVKKWTAEVEYVALEANQTLKRNLHEKGLPRGKIDKITSQFISQMRLEQVKKSRELDAEILDAVIELLEFQRDHFDDWKWDHHRKEIRFFRDKEFNQYEEIVDAMQKLIEEQERLKDEFLKPEK